MNRFLAAAGAVSLGVLCAAPAQAAPFTFTTLLTGAAEAPPNASPATGLATVTIDPVAHLMTVNVTFAGLLGLTTAAHIHAATAAPGTGTVGVATTTPTFTSFPTGVTSGLYVHTFDMTLPSSYNPPFITSNGGTTASAEAALFGAIEDGKAYLNVHSTAFPGGEIRGFLAPVPEPGTMLLLGSGVAGLVLRRRRPRA